MSKLTLNDISGISSSAITVINNNSAAIETAMENTLSLDGTSPNSMLSDLDMNSNSILNLAAPVFPTDVVRVQDMNAAIGILTGVPIGPATGTGLLVLNTSPTLVTPVFSGNIKVSGQGIFLTSTAVINPSDGLGPAIRIGYNTAGDYGYISSNNTGVVAKDLYLLAGGSLTQGIKITAGGAISVPNATNATSAITGSIVTLGGIGANGNMVTSAQTITSYTTNCYSQKIGTNGLVSCALSKDVTTDNYIWQGVSDNSTQALQVAYNLHTDATPSLRRLVVNVVESGVAYKPYSFFEVGAGVQGGYVAIGRTNGALITTGDYFVVGGQMSTNGLVYHTGLPTSAGGGGLSVCVDTAGQFYKKATCP
jgi:hypothetical protein